MFARNGLKLVGGLAETLPEREPPAPIPFRDHFNHEGRSPVSPDLFRAVDDTFDEISRRIEDLAEALGCRTGPDTDRPRAA
jgi:hypothetical protein